MNRRENVVLQRHRKAMSNLNDFVFQFLVVSGIRSVETLHCNVSSSHHVVPLKCMKRNVGTKLNSVSQWTFVEWRMVLSTKCWNTECAIVSAFLERCIKAETLQCNVSTNGDL